MESHGYLSCTCILRVCLIPLSYVQQVRLSHKVPWVPAIHLHPTCPSFTIVLCRTSGTIPWNPMGTSHVLASYMSILSHCPT